MKNMQTILKDTLTQTVSNKEITAHDLITGLNNDIHLTHREMKKHVKMADRGKEWLSKALEFDAQLAKLRRWRKAAPIVLKTYPKIDLSFLNMRAGSRTFEFGIRGTTEQHYNYRYERSVTYEVDPPKKVSIILPIPRFAAFLTKPSQAKEFAFSTRINYWWKKFEYGAVVVYNMEPLTKDVLGLHTPITSHYKSISEEIRECIMQNPDILSIKDRKSRERTDVYIQINTQFPSHYPAEVHERINEISHLFESIYTIAEIHPKNWTLNAYSPAPIPGDPLVIGILRNTAFLIDQFDVTDIEAYVCREFKQ